MIYLLHGENLGASREALIELKRTYSLDSVSVFDAKKLDEDEFVRVCETPSMFAGHRLIIVEGKMKLVSSLALQLSALPPTTDVVFWIPDQLKPSSKLFKQVKELGGQIRLFKPSIPKHVFGFLDALGYKNKEKSFLELHRLLDQGESPVYLLTMIVWQVRNLLNVKCQSSNVKKINPFVRRKTQGQAQNFGEEELVGIFRKLLDAEISLKTTQLDPALVLDLVVGEITDV